MNYPMRGFNFSVEWGGAQIGFMEVSGLAIELDVVSYREGAARENSSVLMPGQARYSPVVLKRGIMASGNDFYQWIDSVRAGANDRRDVVVKLLNERHEPVVAWKIRNAFPFKLDYSPLCAQASEVAIESLSLAHEGLAVEYL